MSDSDIFASDTDIINQTPLKENVIRPKKRRKKKIIKTKPPKTHWFQKDYVKKEDEVDFECDFISPFVFYEIEDILNIDLKLRLINSHIKTIGKFILINGSTYLEQFSGASKIQLIFPGQCPKLNSVVEVFGYIIFGERFVFQIIFWKAIDCNVEQYLSCLKRLRSTVPMKYLKLVNNVSINDSESTLVGNETFSFNEEDESYLVRNVVAYEDYCSEIFRFLSIDTTIFL